MLQLAWAARSHPGLRRHRNEDSVLARPEVFAVADGMGGHAAGDLASQWTVAALDQVADAGPVTRLAVLDAVRDADERLRRYARRRREDMGTTVCALAVTGAGSGGPERFGLLNVGDSRAYRLRSGRLLQLTRDHSVVQELIDAGRITAADAPGHPERHVVTRSLGSDEHLDIDWWRIEPMRQDRYLLTTDGLTKEVTDDGIRSIIGSEPDPHRAADALVDAALARGGRDNVSVIVIDVVLVDAPAVPAQGPDPLDDDTTPRTPRRRRGALDADTEPSRPMR
jgi:serine/threonine protein phosphatase PrpC